MKAEGSPARAVADDGDAVILQISCEGHGLHVERRLHRFLPMSTEGTTEEWGESRSQCCIQLETPLLMLKRLPAGSNEDPSQRVSKNQHGTHLGQME